MKEVVLNNGIGMPVLGFSVCNGNIPYDHDKCEASVLNAIHRGYRMLDIETADSEIAVGHAIISSGIPRNNLFIVRRLTGKDIKHVSVKSAFSVALRRLGLTYIDMYLLDQTCEDRVSAWKGMSELYQEGKIRAIGVSNFQATDILDLVTASGVIPTINQVRIQSGNYENKTQIRSCNQPLRLDETGIDFFGYSISVSINHFEIAAATDCPVAA